MDHAQASKRFPNLVTTGGQKWDPNLDSVKPLSKFKTSTNPNSKINVKKTKNDLNLVFFVDFKCAFVCLEYVFAYCCLFPYYYKQKKYFAHNDNKVTILTLFRMGFFEAAHGLGGGEGKKGYTSHKEDPKNI